MGDDRPYLSRLDSLLSDNDLSDDVPQWFLSVQHLRRLKPKNLRGFYLHPRKVRGRLTPRGRLHLRDPTPLSPRRPYRQIQTPGSRRKRPQR